MAQQLLTSSRLPPLFHTTPKAHARTMLPAAGFRRACLNHYLWVYCILQPFVSPLFKSLFMGVLHPPAFCFTLLEQISSLCFYCPQLIWKSPPPLEASCCDCEQNIMTPSSGSAFTVPPWRSFSFISNSSLLLFNIWVALLRLQKQAHTTHPASPPPMTHCNGYREHMLQYHLLSHAEPLTSASFPKWTRVKLMDKFSRLYMPHVSLLLLSLSSHQGLSFLLIQLKEKQPNLEIS